MEENTAPTKPQILIIPYPAQGHINPAVAFAKHLASRGLHVTLIITTNLSKTAKVSNSTSIHIDFVSDGKEDVDGPDESLEAYFNRLKAVFVQNIAKYLDEQETYPKVVIYDSTLPWILDIAHHRGILGASFFTQCAAVNAVFLHAKEGSLRFPYEDGTVSLPGLPPLEKKDLPSFTYLMDANRTLEKLLVGQWSNVERVDWVFFNTFDKLENEILEWIKSRCAIKTVGPTILLPKKDEDDSDKKNYAVSLFEPKYDACREWLDSRETSSVAYVSFGSIASLGNEQMEELAFGLIMSNCYFLWVVRSSEVDKLPKDFTHLASEKGLIVDWCHQSEVLAHGAIACFTTHCGWNSTLEGLSHGVPLIPMAQWSDQTTNAKFIEDVWKIGVGVKARENGIISREEIAACIKEVVNGDKGIELKENACNFKKLANEAVQKGGTSANNIDDFVSRLIGDKVQ